MIFWVTSKWRYMLHIDFHLFYLLNQEFPTFFVPRTGIFIKKIWRNGCQFECLNFKMHNF